MGDGSFIFLKNSVESTSLISKHVQIECLQEPEAAVCRCSTKQMFLKVSQIPQQKTCVGVFFFNKVAEPAKSTTLIKGDSDTGVFL